MSPNEMPPGDLARRLFSPDACVEDPTGEALRVCAQVTGNLRAVMGDDACNAILSRAWARSQFLHPLLRELRPLSGEDLHFEAIPESVARHGWDAVAAALEALLTALVEVLCSLIGADMVLNILSRELPPSPAPPSGPLK